MIIAKFCIQNAANSTTKHVHYTFRPPPGPKGVVISRYLLQLFTYYDGHTYIHVFAGLYVCILSMNYWLCTIICPNSWYDTGHVGRLRHQVGSQRLRGEAASLPAGPDESIRTHTHTHTYIYIHVRTDTIEFEHQYLEYIQTCHLALLDSLRWSRRDMFQ